MEAIQHAEYQYLNAVNMYEDTLENLLGVVKADTSLLLALDTTINWDGIVSEAELHKMFMEKSFPEDLRNLIAQKIDEDLPLGNLAKWDSLEYILLTYLEQEILNADSSVLLDSLVDWRLLLGESKFWTLYEDVKIPQSIKNRSRLALRKEEPVHETSAWKYLRDTLLVTLDEVVEVANMKDVWSKEEKDDWEKQERASWEAEMDAMSDTINLLVSLRRPNHVKVMVGGAPITEEFAKTIGADGYAQDAASAVDKAKELLRLSSKV